MKLTENFKTICGTECGIQYVCESITPLNLRMNIYRTGKSGSEISINHCRYASKNSRFSIQVTEKLPGNGLENGVKSNVTLEYRL